MMNYQDQIRNNEGMAEDMHDNWLDQQERYDARRKEILGKIVDGLKKYNSVPVFRNAIEAIVIGADPFEIIDRLIETIHNQQKAIQGYLLLHGQPLNPPTNEQ